MTTTAALTVLGNETLGTVSPLLHGHFAEHLGRCCYDGLWVGPESAIPNEGGFRTDVLEALAKLPVPLLRWPGGCFADTYHWREGIGPPASRPRTLAESCGLNVLETNALGTHEFISLCRRIGAEPYLAGNVGTGTPQEMMDWVQYCNSPMDTTLARERRANGHAGPIGVRYWGVGNENWGCGGNYDAADYAKEYKRYATFLRQVQAGTPLELIACGDANRDWNLRVVEGLRNHLSLLDHLSVHRYWAAGHATEFTEDEYYQIMRGAELVEGDIRYADEILRFFAAGRRQVGIAFDEWGIWHPQASARAGMAATSTLRDAVAAAGVLDVFHRWCGCVSLANLAQIVNVLHCLIQTQEDKMWLTPTYHLFHLYAPHQGGAALRTVQGCVPTRDMPAFGRPWPEAAWDAGTLPLVSSSATRKGGQLVLSISNRHLAEALQVEVTLRGLSVSSGTIATLAGDAAHASNSASQPQRVGVQTSALAAQGSVVRLQLPACSVQTAAFALA